MIPAIRARLDALLDRALDAAAPRVFHLAAHVHAHAWNVSKWAVARADAAELRRAAADDTPPWEES